MIHNYLLQIFWVLFLKFEFITKYRVYGNDDGFEPMVFCTQNKHATKLGL
jgi:hypothetical protein